MKKLFPILPFAGLLIIFIWQPQNPIDLLGYVISQIYAIWNIYAFIYQRKMYPPMNYGIDYSNTGNTSARAFLAGVCFVLYVSIGAIWIFRITHT